MQGPGLDFPLMGFLRFLNSSNRFELFYVTDGQGRQYSVGDSLGTWSKNWDIGGYRGWRWAGGSQNAQTFAVDRMGNSQENPISFFRNRAYDLNTGRYTQEDPIGLAGGVKSIQLRREQSSFLHRSFRTLPTDRQKHG